MFKKVLFFIKEYISEIFISLFFILALGITIYYKDMIFKKGCIKYYIMPIVVTVGVFLTWLQFIFYKYNKKREAALTYFPRPMELEKIESEIDEVINLWSKSDVLADYVVNLLVGENISNLE
jgi:hypothetical protein